MPKNSGNPTGKGEQLKNVSNTLKMFLGIQTKTPRIANVPLEPQKPKKKKRKRGKK